MVKRLQDKVVVISGAAQGQGSAHAWACAREGASVVLGDINLDDGAAVAAAIRAEGMSAVFGRLDVTSSADWDTVVTLARREFGPVTCLVNNAGIASSAGVVDTSDDEWARTVAVNQTGMFLGIRQVAPAISAAGGGSIVNIASTLGFFASPVGFAYQATKGAIRMMSKSAALSLAPDGIRVNTVLPGLVDTPFLDDLRSVGALENSIRRTPLARTAQPHEISAAVLFLLSDDSSYMTGAELVVDGGMTAGSTGSLQPAASFQSGDAS